MQTKFDEFRSLFSRTFARNFARNFTRKVLPWNDISSEISKVSHDISEGQTKNRYRENSQKRKFAGQLAATTMTKNLSDSKVHIASDHTAEKSVWIPEQNLS